MFLKIKNSKNLFKKNLFFQSTEKILPETIKLKIDYSFEEFSKVQQDVFSVKKQEDIIKLFQKWEYNLTDFFLAQVFTNILDYQMELDEDFEKKVSPYICHYLSIMDRNNSLAFGKILYVMSLFEIKSATLWQSLSKTFIEQRMHRYVPVRLMSDSIVNFGLWENPPKKLIELMLPSVSKHINSVEQKNQQELHNALNKMQLELKSQQKELKYLDEQLFLIYNVQKKF